MASASVVIATVTAADAEVVEVDVAEVVEVDVVEVVVVAPTT
jgi:hypothetical protein